jgi:predicted esterase
LRDPAQDSPPPPHGGGPVREKGRPAAEAKAAMILLHGRGGDAAGILTLADELGNPDFAYLAPLAAAHTWYPNRFLAPLEANEPALSSGLAVMADLIHRLGDEGLPPERTILLGFSQGACLTVEFAARNPRRYGGVVALTGGLLGPPGAPLEHPGSLEGTPVFLGTADPDPHVPVERVRETAEVLTAMDARVDLCVYPGMGHTVSWEELKAVRAMMADLVSRP